MDLFADNAELFAKLKEGNPGYDLIVPTNDFVERMISAGMLTEPLDHDRIPNKANLAPAFAGGASFDPGRKFSMPYMWGTQGIGYRKSRVGREPDSWKVLFESDEFLGANLAAVRADHHDGRRPRLPRLLAEQRGTRTRSSEAEELLIKQKKHIKVFAQDNGQDLLLSGEVDLAMEWNGDILQVMEEDDDISYVVPKRRLASCGRTALCIPTGAPHPENAHAFIDYILNARRPAPRSPTSSSTRRPTRPPRR